MTKSSVTIRCFEDLWSLYTCAFLGGDAPPCSSFSIAAHELSGAKEAEVEKLVFDRLKAPFVTLESRQLWSSQSRMQRELWLSSP